ncbi:LOW QUALITY PROTEIN: hypothetical protein PHMEG_00029880 [Phytophthora megakarya]|uniref:Uncharacterized protein n=1 Tax=Phytophthora megakarya TaxID=4795 RepID=A0A225V2I1_9STRA|nr:LOW QUALITY PROTEIN: hypothetical protein PHMEG_00029880 [Phytophthora megakarya]
MFSMCWVDREPKTVILNQGTTFPGSDSHWTYHRLTERDGVVETFRYEKWVSRQHMMELFFYFRQLTFMITTGRCIARNWTHRLFSTLLSMMVVDAFLAHRYDTAEEAEMLFL